MSGSQRPALFPRGALIGAALLLGGTLALVAGMRLGDIEPVARVATPAEPVASRALRFEDRANGDVVVYDVAGGGERAIAVFPSGQGGFLRGVLRSMARARRARGIGDEVPFRLSRRADGGLLLADPATGHRIYLQAFGPTNADTFARLLAANEDRQ